MSHSSIEPDKVVQDLSEHPYYKGLRKSLKEKADNNTKKLEESSRVTVEKREVDKKKSIENQEKKINFEDKISISNLSWETTSEESNTSERDKKADKKRDKVVKDYLDEIKTDARLILKNLTIKLDYKRRIPEFKEMFKYNMIQARSHNFFMAKFSDFKVGVVGHILHFSGVSIEELSDLKKEAIKEAIDENNEIMSENIYNQELSEIICGKRRKNKQIHEMYKEIQSQVITTLQKLGRSGYWTQDKLIEERRKQCQKIEQELIEEKLKLEYQVELIIQETHENG